MKRQPRDPRVDVGRLDVEVADRQRRLRQRRRQPDVVAFEEARRSGAPGGAGRAAATMNSAALRPRAALGDRVGQRLDELAVGQRAAGRARDVGHDVRAEHRDEAALERRRSRSSATLPRRRGRAIRTARAASSTAATQSACDRDAGRRASRANAMRSARRRERSTSSSYGRAGGAAAVRIAGQRPGDRVEQRGAVAHAARDDVLRSQARSALRRRPGRR